MKAVGDDGEPANNPVCKAILAFIAGSKNGADIRTNFEDSPYGWSRDAVDGGLQVLLIAGSIRAHDDHGGVVDPRELERKAIGKTNFKIESIIVTTKQLIEIRKVFQRIGLQVKQGEESATISEFLEHTTNLAERAGGDAPKPERPDTTSLDEIRLASGNTQLLVIYNRREELKTDIGTWADQAKRIEKRWPTWENLQNLLKYAGDLKAAQEARQQAEAIEKQRLLLMEPDPILPLLKSLENALRSELTARQKRYADELEKKNKELGADDSWQQLDENKRASIFSQAGIADVPKLTLGTHRELVAALEQHPLAVWRDRIDALPSRFDRARELAAPDMQTVNIPRRKLKSTGDVDAWVKDVHEKLNKAVAKGPVLIR